MANAAVSAWRETLQATTRQLRKAVNDDGIASATVVARMHLGIETDKSGSWRIAGKAAAPLVGELVDVALDGGVQRIALVQQSGWIEIECELTITEVSGE